MVVSCIGGVVTTTRAGGRGIGETIFVGGELTCRWLIFGKDAAVGFPFWSATALHVALTLAQCACMQAVIAGTPEGIDVAQSRRASPPHASFRASKDAEAPGAADNDAATTATTAGLM